MPVTELITRVNDQLLVGTQPFKIVGANTYYLAYVPETTLDSALQLAQSLHLNAIRIWAFFDVPTPAAVYFQTWDAANNAPVINPGPNGLERLDRAIAKASEAGIRLILTLTNYWKDFGGIPQYAQWFGLKPEEQDRFYTDARCQAAYQSYVRQLVERRNSITGQLYRNDPAILAWELANEPRCPGSVQTLLEWVGKMAGYLKTLDPNHLIAVGDEGYFNRQRAGNNALYNGCHGVSCEQLLGVGEIDFGTVHMYPESMAPDQDPVQFGRMWITEHIEAGRRANKPILIEEYGAITKPQTDRNAIFEQWLRYVEDQNGVGDMLWMLGLPKSTDQPYGLDGYVVTNASEVPAILAHALRFSTDSRMYASS